MKNDAALAARRRRAWAALGLGPLWLPRAEALPGAPQPMHATMAGPLAAPEAEAGASEASGYDAGVHASDVWQAREASADTVAMVGESPAPSVHSTPSVGSSSGISEPVATADPAVATGGLSRRSADVASSARKSDDTVAEGGPEPGHPAWADDVPLESWGGEPCPSRCCPPNPNPNRCRIRTCHRHSAGSGCARRWTDADAADWPRRARTRYLAADVRSRPAGC